jgi:hypothetical protein
MKQFEAHRAWALANEPQYQKFSLSHGLAVIE